MKNSRVKVVMVLLLALFCYEYICVKAFPTTDEIWFSFFWLAFAGGAHLCEQGALLYASWIRAFSTTVSILARSAFF